MILKRRIYSKLLEWKENVKGSKAILIEGARRVGKTFLLRQFAPNITKNAKTAASCGLCTK